MRLAIELDGVRHEVETSQYAETATLADLVEAVCGTGVPGEETLFVDDREHTGNARLSDLLLLEGSRVARSPLETPSPVRGWTALMAGGLDAGRTLAVPTRRALFIGRSPQADLTVDSPSASWSHATIEHATETVGADEDEDAEGRKRKRKDKQAEDEPTPEPETLEGLRIKDEGSTNGTFVDGVRVPEEGIFVTGDAVVVVGGTSVLLRKDLAETLAPAPGSLHNVTTAGTAPFNRPPRPGRPPEPDPVVPPVQKDPPAPHRFSVATVVAPLLLAVVMVMMMGPRMAVIALMSPVIAVGTWWEQKRRRRTDVGEEDERFADALDAFRGDVEEAARAERARRRDDVPDPATMLRRASLPTTKLWQRRPGAGEMLRLHAGVGDVPWEPGLDTSAGNRLDDRVRSVLGETRIAAAPVEVDLTDAGVVGIVGDREGALAVARSLLCQATIHAGPADMTVGVFCDTGRDEAWRWTTWLPHVRHVGDGAGGQWLSAQRGRSEALLRSLRDGIDGHITPTVLLVIDSDVLTEGRDAPARALLGHGRPTGSGGIGAAKDKGTQVSGIVIAANEEQLPASCTTVVRVQPDAQGTVTRPDDLTTVDDVVLAGLEIATARRCATDLARFDDPELVVPGAALPGLVRLSPLLGLEEMTAEAIRKSWASSTRISTPVGVGESGGYEIDLVRDGPHGLVGGTTGSGKSEFLRSLVAGLAARNDPTRLTFILIDFKGGAAFATCERLPHTIGTVSNLDEQLADRALRALEAEMNYRQRVFAQAGEGIDNLDAYLATNPEQPMPRLLLVVDEFAMLAKEYPDVLSSLVSVAAVGRTLGVHMILATQRPAGVVNEDILANTNLRVALRVQSRDDSVNVVGVPAASAIGRTQMGRAFVKLGQDDITPVQTALVTGRSESAASTLVDAHPIGFGEVLEPARPATPVDEDAPTDLDLLIDAVVAANEEAGFAPPRPVWPEPLGEHLELTATHEGDDDQVRSVGAVVGSTVQVALADDPDRQRQIPVGWDLARGNLLLMGIPGSGTSTTLCSIALTMAAEHAPDELDLIVLDMGSRDLEPLAALPHCAAYVGSGSASREQQVRLMKHVRAELDRRRTTPGPHRKTLVLVDGLAALRDEYDDFEGIKLLDGLYRAYADGPDVGLWTAATTSRAKSVPSAIDEVTTQKWLFRLADTYDYASAGVPVKFAPAAVAGRCVFAETKLQTHVASPSSSLRDAVALVGARWPGSGPKATVVGQLPERVAVSELGAHAQLAGEPWRIPVGIRESDLEPAMLEAYEGEHVLVAGPPRSGRSTTLLAILEALRAGAVAEGVDLAVWGICGRRSPLAGAPLDRCVSGDDGLAALLAAARVHRGRLVILIDDAEQFDDADQAIVGLLGARTSDLLVVAAGRSDDLRTMYGHWTRTVRKSRSGILLQPNVDYDGELLGANLPRRAPVAMSVARGYVASGGTLEFLQVASPTS